MFARCPVCWRNLGEPDEFSPHIGLQHMVTNHPRSETLQEWMRDETVDAPCRECNSWFEASVNVDVNEGILSRKAVCEECCEWNPAKGLLCLPTTAKAVVEGRETDANKPEGWTTPNREKMQVDIPPSVSPDRLIGDDDMGDDS